MCSKLRDKTTDQLLDEIENELDVLESRLPRRLSGMEVSRLSKLPYKALLYREGLMWRACELGRSALASFRGEKLVTAVLLTRAVVETSAALWFLRTRIKAAVEFRSIADIDDCLMKLLMGTKANLDIQPEAFNVLKFIDVLKKEIPDIRHHYEMLSEFAHPNWAGTALAYSKHDKAARATDFGPYIRSAASAKRAGAANLSGSLLLFEAAYGQLAELMPRFVKLCEDHT
jgi:hypothetical protein